MKCECGKQMRVYDVAEKDGSVFRARKCVDCKKVIYTEECECLDIELCKDAFRERRYKNMGRL